MITIQGKIPRKVVLACSGGVDSMAIADFLSANHDLTLHFVHHGTETSKIAYDFINEYGMENNLKVLVNFIDDKKPERESQEEFWRNQRYKFFHSWGETPVITCHHLDDCVETWIWSSLNGTGKIIPYRNLNVIRPFRTTKKQDLIEWAQRKGVSWVEDKSNSDPKYIRNYIRHELMPHALKVNPGIQKTILKKVERT
jgi:tRNA(Ile)-lysidine synthase